MSNMSLVEIVGIAAAISLLVALWTRPAGLFAVVVAFVIVGAAILVSWHDVLQFRAQRDARAAFQQELAKASPAVSVPPSGTVRAGS
jgi:hypothetical protein